MFGSTEPQSYVQTSHYNDFPQWSQVVEKNEDQFRAYQRSFLSAIQAVIRKGRLLDVGCSLGLLVDEANRLGYVAEGVDLDSHAVEFAKAKGRPVSLGRLEELESGNYDVICLSHTLEHIAQPKEFLTECIRHLAPDGILAVAVPCHAGLLPKLFPKWWYGWMPAQHYRHYSAKAMETPFLNAGIQPMRMCQTSMDHRLKAEYIQRWQDLIKGVIVRTTAFVGNAFGSGDQLIAIGKVAPNRS